MLHRMNPARMSFIRNKLAHCFDEEATKEGLDESPRTSGQLPLLQGMNVLDVGCGGGLLSECLARLGANTTAVDASQSNINVAKLHSAQDSTLSENLRYIHGTAEDMSAMGLEYDAVFSMEVLEHVENPSDFLANCAKLVKPGGHLFLSSISRTPTSYFFTIFMAEHVLRLVRPGTHEYAKYIKSSEIIEFFSRPEIGWISGTYDSVPTRKEAEVRQITFNPVAGTWTVQPTGSFFSSLECNYMFWARRPT